MFLDIVDSGNDVLSRAIGLFRMALATEPVQWMSVIRAETPSEPSEHHNIENTPF